MQKLVLVLLALVLEGQRAILTSVDLIFIDAQGLPVNFSELNSRPMARGLRLLFVQIELPFLGEAPVAEHYGACFRIYAELKLADHLFVRRLFHFRVFDFAGVVRAFFLVVLQVVFLPEFANALNRTAVIVVAHHEVASVNLRLLLRPTLGVLFVVLFEV